jgi:hypothetical protein
MINTIRLIVSMLAFLVIYAFVIAPALQQFITAVEPFSDGAIGGVFGPTQTALFLAMPLLLLGGIIVLGFVIATGLRGTSLER